MSDLLGEPELAAIRHLADAYAIAVDRRDLNALRACFAAGGRLSVLSGSRTPREYLGHEGLAGVMVEMGRFELTVHHVTTCCLGGDRRQPRGTVYCIAHHLERSADGISDLVLHVRYDDVYRSGEPGRWWFEERTVNVLFSERRAVRIR